MTPQLVDAVPAAEKRGFSRFAVYAWCVLAYNLAVVAWGAFVRATGSGAGCGSHWPMCNGELVPRGRQIETLIEFGHRVTAGLSSLLVFGLIVFAFVTLPKRHPARRAAVFAGAFTFLEALIGAGLVLFQKVAKDQSAGRIVYLSVHLINTFLLVGAIALTAWFASGMPRPRRWSRASLVGLLGLLVLGVSGAITALGDTLYPSASLTAAFREDFNPAAIFLVAFRKYHPLIAIAVGAYVAWFCRDKGNRRLSLTVIGLVAIQWAFGALAVWWLAPIWMQLVHLLLADLLWIAALLHAATLEDDGLLHRPVHSS